MPPTKDRMLLYRQITDIVSLRFGLICLNFFIEVVLYLIPFRIST